MKSNKVVAFSLLAHINDNAVGIKDFDDIFQPLIKTALCKLNTEGVKSGSSLSEIKSKVDEIFALDIPIPYLKKLLEKIAKETLAIEEVNLTIHQDGSFLIDNFIFEDFEIQIAETEDEISEINKLYEVFLETEGLKLSQELSIFEYLDKSRLRLSKFFAYKQAKLLELDDVHQANFINSLRNKPKLFNALRRIYLGSIISAYLITDFGEVKRDLELLLDTNFIIGLLDLNSIESTHTCNKIIELAKKLGFRVSVLPYTLEETELLIERKANQLSKSFFQGYLDPESILNAAIRKGYTKTQLIQIGANLRQTLENQFGVDVIGNDEKFKNLAKFQYRKILEFYQELRGRFGWSAHHDTTAIAYVKEKRGRRRVTGNFMNAKCWFVTNTPYDVKTPKTDGLPEVIRAGELLSLLWLSSPQVKELINGTEFSDLGLTRLVSTTISHSLPNSRTLRELDENFSKYSTEDGITADDTLIIANLIKKKKIKDPEKLNKLAKNNPNEFIEEVKKTAEKGRKEDQELKEKVEILLTRFERMFPKSELPETEPESKFEETAVNRNKLEIPLAIISLSFLSFLLWTFERIFDIDLSSVLNNYFLIKLLLQIMLITSALALIKREKKFWWSTFISFIIAIFTLIKK